MLNLLLAIVVFLVVFGISVWEFFVRKAGLQAYKFTAEDIKKAKVQGVIDRGFDLLFCVFLIAAAQILIVRINGGACPLRSSFGKLVLKGTVAIIPVALGYLWMLLPLGRQGALEAALSKTAKAAPSKLSRLHNLLWYPWLGVVYIAVYILGGIFVFFSAVR